MFPGILVAIYFIVLFVCGNCILHMLPVLHCSLIALLVVKHSFKDHIRVTVTMLAYEVGYKHEQRLVFLSSDVRYSPQRLLGHRCGQPGRSRESHFCSERKGRGETEEKITEVNYYTVRTR